GFSAQAQNNVTFTLPAGTAQPLTFSSSDQTYQLDQSFATKAALDAAFPNGTYRMNGTGVNLSFNLTADAYPTATPQVISGGTWNAGGLLVVNPNQTTTINFSTFTTYVTGGVGGHMQVRIQGQSDNVRLQNEILSVANPFGLTATTTPITSITIP